MLSSLYLQYGGAVLFPHFNDVAAPLV